jgi:hypothetical protein
MARDRRNVARARAPAGGGRSRPDSTQLSRRPLTTPQSRPRRRQRRHLRAVCRGTRQETSPTGPAASAWCRPPRPLPNGSSSRQSGDAAATDLAAVCAETSAAQRPPELRCHRDFTSDHHLGEYERPPARHPCRSVKRIRSRAVSQLSAPPVEGWCTPSPSAARLPRNHAPKRAHVCQSECWGCPQVSPR